MNKNGKNYRPITCILTTSVKCRNSASKTNSLTFVWYNMQTEILPYKVFKLKFPSFLMVSLNQHNVNDIRFILAYDIKYVLI